MRVSGLTSDGDWRFGKGRASYLRRSEAIRQNVVTRLKSFTDDWFLNINEGIPWIELLGSKQTQSRILREVESRVLATEGVRTITRLRLVEIDVNRSATIELSFVDVFDTSFDERVNIA